MNVDFAARSVKRLARKDGLPLAVCFAVCLLAADAVSAKSPAGGFRGVPWTGSKEDFKRAIPSLTCFPMSCAGPLEVGDIPTKIDIVWGGFAAHATSITMKFPVGRVADMAKVLRQKYGLPSNQHREDGELVSEWKLPDVLVDLYHGQRGESDGQVYFEPVAQAKIQHEEFLEWKKKHDAQRKVRMKDAASAW